MRPLTQSRSPAVFVTAMLALASCATQDDAALARRRPATVSSDFESGNIGAVQKLDDTEWVLSLRDDNDNPDLPDSWRTWWYVRFDNLSTTAPTAVTVNNNVWPYYYVPVYSYDQNVWHRFDEAEVTQPDASSIKVVKQFAQSTVWTARFYPYTLTDLDNYLGRCKPSNYVSREVVGETTQGHPIEVVTITNPSVDDAGKRRIWLHARTHPAETGSSFVLEGLIDFLLSGDGDAETLVSNFVVSIVPMHNIDGVVIGNYRTTPASENLESLWLRDPGDPFRLTPDAPHEVQVLHDAIAATLQSPAAIPVTMALNLHSSNSEPDTAPFFFPHFGPAALGYTADEVALWTQQLAFADAVEAFYGTGRIEPRPAEGGPSFVTGNFPESWWWENTHADVMAMTLETVYGRAGFAPRWVVPDDLRALGHALALAMLAYHGLPVVAARTQPEAPRAGSARGLRFPDLYPPALEFQLKAE